MRETARSGTEQRTSSRRPRRPGAFVAAIRDDSPVRQVRSRQWRAVCAFRSRAEAVAPHTHADLAALGQGQSAANGDPDDRQRDRRADSAAHTADSALCAPLVLCPDLRRQIFRPGVDELVSGPRPASLESRSHRSRGVKSSASAAVPDPDRHVRHPALGDQTSCSASHEANSTGWGAFGQSSAFPT
jgi:hypothetical protein